MRYYFKYKLAFSLLELVIFMSAVAFLMVVVNYSGALVKQSKLQKTVGELTAIQNAINTFNITYDALPGDFNKANEIWPSEQNGNGDERLDDISEADSNWYNHLLAAKIINNFNLDNDNRPKISLTNWGIELIYDDLWSKYQVRNILRITDNDNLGTILNGDDAYNLDSKLDDNKPYSGNVLITASDENCNENGMNGSAYCCSDNYAMVNDDFQINNDNIKNANYQSEATNCAFIFYKLKL